ncbi:unnamed protein product, partial [Ectocarpus sp. 13 AM-2016]
PSHRTRGPLERLASKSSARCRACAGSRQTARTPSRRPAGARPRCRPRGRCCPPRCRALPGGPPGRPGRPLLVRSGRRQDIVVGQLQDKNFLALYCLECLWWSGVIGQVNERGLVV